MHHILPTIERKYTGYIKRIPRKDKRIAYEKLGIIKPTILTRMHLIQEYQS